MRIRVREKRQVTLPAELLDAIGVKPGDSLEVEAENGRLTMRPSRKAALDALDVLRKAFEATGLSEEEWLSGLKDIRAEVFQETYPEHAKRHAN